jgi:hypothetical protein
VKVVKIVTMKVSLKRFVTAKNAKGGSVQIVPKWDGARFVKIGFVWVATHVRSVLVTVAITCATNASQIGVSNALTVSDMFVGTVRRGLAVACFFVVTVPGMIGVIVDFAFAPSACVTIAMRREA